MTKEQEKSIEIVKNYLNNSAYKKSNNDFFKNGGWEVVDLEIPKAIETVLSMLQEQQEENKKKDKIINEMIEEYEYNDRINLKNFCDEEIRKDKCIENCTICITKYFERKVEE